MLGEKNWDFTSDSVQAYWNQFEIQLISIIDGLAPLTEVVNEEFPYIIKKYIMFLTNKRLINISPVILLTIKPKYY